MALQNIILDTVEYIEAHLADALKLDAVCRRAGYSKFYLNRKFSEETGCTICKYIQLRRLSHAAWQLCRTAAPISDIAFDAGYKSQQAFAHAFRRVFACTPQAYRAVGVYAPAMPRYTGRRAFAPMAHGGRCMAA